MLVFSTAEAQVRPVLKPVNRNYFAGKFLLVPGDDLPTSTQLTRMIAAVADHDLVIPSDRLFGSDDKLLEWASGLDYDEIDGAVISLDGLVRAGDRALDLLRTIRARRPRMPLYAAVTLTEASGVMASSLVGLLAEDRIDYLLLSSGDGREPWADLNARIRAQRLQGRVAFTVGKGSGTASSLLTRMANRRFGYEPRVLPVYSAGIEGPSATIARMVSEEISLGGGFEVRQTPEAARNLEVLLFVHLPGTDDRSRVAFADACAQSLERNVRVAVLDLSESAVTREKLFVMLRERKLLDKLASYASPDPDGRDARGAVATAVAQICSFLVSIRFLRDDLDRVRRIDRAQVSLLLGQYLSDWAFPLKIRIGEAKDLPEQAIAGRIREISEELFDEQFRRNIHAFLLSSGERARIEVRMIQRLQLKLFNSPGSTRQDLFVRPSVYLVYQGNIPTPQLRQTSSWELKSEDIDDRVGYRWSSINWPSFASDQELVEVSIRISPKSMPPGPTGAGYSIQSRRTRTSRKIEVLASSAEGAFNALAKLERMGIDGKLAGDFQLTENPRFSYRGLIDDRSVSQLTHRDRIEMLHSMGRLRLNRYYFFAQGYGAARLRELLSAAGDNFIELVCAYDASSMSAEEPESAFTDGVRAGLLNFAVVFDAARDPARTAVDAAIVARIRSALQARMASARLSVIVRDAAPAAGYIGSLAMRLPPDVQLVIDKSGADAGATTRTRPVTAYRATGDDASESGACLNLMPGNYRAPGAEVDGVAFVLTPQPRTGLMLAASFSEFAWEPDTYNRQLSFDRTLKLLFDERSRNGILSWARIIGDCNRDNPLSVIRMMNDPDSARRRLDELKYSIEQVSGTRERGLLRAELAGFLSRARDILDKIISK